MPFLRLLTPVIVVLRLSAVLALLWSTAGEPLRAARAAEPYAVQFTEFPAELSQSDLYPYRDLFFEPGVKDAFGIGPVSWSSSPGSQLVLDDGDGEGRMPAMSVLAATCYWAGSTSADWHTAANWSGCGVPAEGDQVIIPAGVVPNEPNIGVADVTLGGLTVDPGRTMTIGAGRVVTIANATMSNSGTITGTGTLRTQGNVTLSQNGAFNSDLRIVSGTASANGGTYDGSMAVDAGTTMVVNGTVIARGDVSVNGTVMGYDGSQMVFRGANFSNNGNISPRGFTFDGNGAQNVTGSGSFTHRYNWMTIGISSTTSIAGPSFSLDYLTINGTLAISGPVTAEVWNFRNYGTLGIDSTLLHTVTGGNFTNYNGGVITGTGTLRTGGSPNLTQSGTFNAGLRIVSGTTNMGGGAYNGPITVDAGATLSVNGWSNVMANGDVTINGAVTGLDGTQMTFRGANFVNNGNVGPRGFLFDRDGAQNVTGSGSFTHQWNWLTIGISSTTSIGGPSFTLEYLTVNGALSVTAPITAAVSAFRNNGTISISSTLLYSLSGGSMTNYSTGVVTGTGTLRIGGSPTLNQSGIFDAPIRIVAGTTSFNTGVYGGPLAVDAGAAMQINQGNTLTVNGDMIIDGSVAGSGDGRQLLFGGRNLVNNGPFSLGYWPGITFNRAGVQTLSGAGYFYDGPVNVASGTALRMGSDYAGMGRALTVASGGALDLANHILTASSYSQGVTATLAVSVAGYLPGVTFGQLRTSGTASLAGALESRFGNSFDPVVGDTFRVVSATQLNNTFATITSTSGVEVTPVYDSKSVSLSVTTVYTTADLSIQKTAPPFVNSGDLFTYTLSIANASPRTAESPRVVDTLPPGMTYYQRVSSGWLCDYAWQILTCTRPELPSGPAPTITIGVWSTPGGMITNSATITSTRFDPDMANNTALASTFVITGSGLSLNKVASANEAIIGAPLTYTIRITNTGPEVAGNVVFTDDLPSGLSSVSVAASGWDCGQGSGTITCSRSSLAVGTVPSITVSGVVALASGTLTNTARVSSSNYDYYTADNLSTSVVAVTPVLAHFSASEAVTSESLGTASIVARLTTTPVLPVTVVYGVTGGTASGSGERVDYALDFTGVTTTLTFNPGQTVLTRTVTIVDDTYYEQTEMLYFALTNPTNAELGSPATFDLSIVSGDALPQVYFADASPWVGESAGVAAIPVRLSHVSELTSNISISTFGGTAVAGNDYLTATGRVTFTPGITLAYFYVPIVHDTLGGEPITETVELTLENPGNVPIWGGGRYSTLSIVDDDAPPVIQFSHEGYRVVEGQTAYITATLNYAAGVTATVRFTTAHGTADSSDYTSRDVIIQFAPGVTRTTATVPTLGGSSLAEPDETVLLALSEPANARLGSYRYGAMLTIVDDDIPRVRFESEGLRVSESSGSLSPRVLLSIPSTLTATVGYRIYSIGAAVDADFRTALTGTLTFGPGDTAEDIPAIAIVQDSDDEPDETLRIELANPTNAGYGTPGRYDITILDDDPTPEVPPTDLSAVALEVTQGVQDLLNRVRLVDGKRTYVRFHVGAATGGHRTKARLRLIRSNGQDLLLNPVNAGPDGANEVQEYPQRTMDHAILFELPQSWAGGTLTVTGNLNYTREPVETSYANNIITTTVTFESVPTVRLKLYKILWYQWMYVGWSWLPTDNAYQSQDSHLDSIESFLKIVFPVSDWQIERRDYVYNNKVGDIVGAHLPVDLGVLKLVNMAQNNDGDLGLFPSSYYYGAAPPELALYAAPYHVGPVGVGTVEPNGEINAAMALAAYYSLLDAPFCWPEPISGWFPYEEGRISPSLWGNDAVYGFDLETRQIKAPYSKDIMTACDSRWMSDWSYERIMDYLQQNGSAPSTSSPTLSPATRVDRLLIAGTVNTATNQVDLQPLIVVPNALDAKPAVPGSYAIVLRDGSAAELARYAFTPTPISSTVASIAELVPYVTGTMRVDITGPGGATLKTITAGASSPTATITAPVFPGGIGLLSGDPITITWEAGDADLADTLTFNVSYSRDNGASWQLLASNLVSRTIAINASNVVSTTGGRFRVGVSDGIHTSYALSDPFVVPNRPPEVEIVSPSDGYTIGVSQTLSLRGRAYDPDFGTMPRAQVAWSSNRDGLLGNGAELSTASLTLGTHEITLAADDGSGGLASDSIEVSVVTDTYRIALLPDALQVGPSYVILNPSNGTTSQWVYLANQAGTTPISWTASLTATWLQLSAASGSTNAIITATLASAGLSPGSHQAAIVFNSPGVAGGPITVTVQAVIPTSPDSVAVAGSAAGTAGATYAFTATVSPASTTLPLTYTWWATDQSIVVISAGLTSSASYSWSTAGTKAITVTSTNAGATVTATHSIDISVPPSSVAVDGPSTGLTGATYAFTATVSSASTTLPITYTWQATDQSAVVDAGSASLADAVSFTWSTAGTKSVTIWVTNAGGTVSATRTIAIVDPPPSEYRLYLPITVRSHSGGW